MNHKWGAIAIIVGTTIGAGILGLPKAFSNTNLVSGILVILIVALLMLITNLSIGEISLRIRDNHQLPGLAERILGKKGRIIVMIAMLLSIYGAMTAYLIGIPSILNELVGGSIYVYAIILWLIISLLIYRGIKTVAGTELALGIGLISIILIISLYSLPHININNYSINNTDIFTLYGVALFAFMGMVAIPEAREALRGREKNLYSAINIGMLIPLIIYLMFAIITVGVTGSNTTEIATIGLGRMLGDAFLIFGNLFAIIAMLTSFIALSNAGIEMYLYDLKLKKFASLLLTMIPPLALFIFLRGQGFEKVLSITGAITGAILGITIMHMYYKARNIKDREPEYMLKLPRIGIILIDLLFIIGLLTILK